MALRWIVFLGLIPLLPMAGATSPSSPIDLAMRIDDTPSLDQPFPVTLDITAHLDIGNVTVDVDVPPGWEKSPAQNRTFNLRRDEQRTVRWTVTPTSEGFWILRGTLETVGGGMTSRTQHYGFLHGNESRSSTNPEDVIPPFVIDLQFRGVEESPANVTLIATAAPQAAWMRFGTLSMDIGILNETRTAHGPGSRALTATLTTPVPPYHGARAWSQFGFTPDWRTEMPPGTGRYGTGLGCRDLWVTREAGPSLVIEASRDCDDTRHNFAPGPGIAVLGLLAATAVCIRRLRPAPDHRFDNGSKSRA